MWWRRSQFGFGGVQGGYALTFDPKSETLSTWWIGGSDVGADKAEGNVLVLFIPSVDRRGDAIDQQHWEAESLATLGTLFGGATAFPQGRGVWRDDERGGRLIYDAPVIIQCYKSEEALGGKADELREFLVRMGESTRQGAVGFVIDRSYLEIKFPLQ